MCKQFADSRGMSTYIIRKHSSAALYHILSIQFNNVFVSKQGKNGYLTILASDLGNRVCLFQKYLTICDDPLYYLGYL